MPGDHHVVVRLLPKDGHASMLEAELVALATASVASPYCLRFDVAILTDGAGYLLHEAFVDAEAYARHCETAHARRFLDKALPEHVADRVVEVLRPRNGT